MCLRMWNVFDVCCVGAIRVAQRKFSLRTIERFLNEDDKLKIENRSDSQKRIN